MQNQSKRTIKPKFIQQQERLLKEQYGSKVEISTSKNIGKSRLNLNQKTSLKELFSN